MTGEIPAARSWLHRFSGRHPLFVAAVVCAAAVIAWNHHWLAGCSVPFACAWAAWKWSGARRALLWLATGAVSLTVFHTRTAYRDEAERVLLASPHGPAGARILKDAEGGERAWAAPARLIGGPVPDAKVWWEGCGAMPVAGAIVAAEGVFQSPPEPRNPGEFDRAKWLRGQGVAALFHSDRETGRMTVAGLARRGAALRHGFRERVTAGIDPESEEAVVIRAVVIGEQPPDADALIAAFRNSGTLHVFSVSGLHVAMVGSIGWLALSWLGVPRRWAVPLLLPLIFGYSWITGNSAPAVRSAWMAALFLGAFTFRRKPDLLNALGGVLLAVTLWDGRLLFQPGVQLSYGVVAAIAVGTGWAMRTFSWMAEADPLMPATMLNRWQIAWHKLRVRLAQYLSVSVAAAVGSTPLTLAHFGLATPVSVLAGFILLPLVFVVLSLALLSAAISVVAPPVSESLNRLNGLAATASVRSAELFSAIPGGHFRLRRETGPFLLAYDLGYGAGAACFSGDDGAVLIDCGDRPGFRYQVAPSLRTLGVEPDSVVLSHPDGGHLGGGSAVWRAFPIRQALLPVKLARSPSFRQWTHEAPAAGVRLHPATIGRILPMPDQATLEVIHCADPLAVNSRADDRVAVFRLHWRGWRILFTSDAGMGTELAIRDAGRDITSDVIIAGRHRDDLTLCDRFLDAVNPQAIIASNPPFPVSEKLQPSTTRYWESRGIRVIDQRVSGGVTLKIDEGGALVIDGFLTDEPLVLEKR
jgi:competence protein ComEC